ncbi:MAG: Ig-like domain-containing protein, partial [Oscillospiraceae bacterium]|nr:Ig-like domain-containing protein [Oscillospiraceae bacterium]
MNKRIISLVLSLCLIVSLVPVGLVSAEEKNGVYVEYDIMGNADTGKTLKFAEYLTYENTNGFFDYVSDSVGDEAPKKYRMRYNAYKTIEIYNGHWIIFKINVPKAGTYDVKVKNHVTAKGQLLNAYIFPTSVTPNASALSDEHFIGAVDCNNSTGKDGKTTPNSFMKDGSAASYTFAAAGEYYIGFKSSAAEGVTGTEYAYLGNIVLDGGTGKAYMGKYELPGDSVSVMQTKTRDVSVSVLLSDNTWGKAEISNCESADEGIATVTDSGRIRGVALGETEVTFDASYGGASVGSFTLPVKVVENDGITIKYDLAKVYNDTNMNEDKTFAGNVTYENTDGFFRYMSDSRNDPATKNYHLRWKNGMFEMYQGNWIFLEINVPKAGDYDISMYNGKALLGGDLSVYVLESDGEKPGAADLTEGNFVGTISCNDTSVAKGKIAKVTNPTEVGSHYFAEAGKYYIGFRAHDTALVPDPLPEGALVTDYADYAYIGDIVMSSGENLVVMRAYPKYDKLTLSPNQQTKLLVYGIISDVTETELSCSDFKVAEGGESIVSVSNDGVVTALSEGEATVTYTASYKNSYAESFETDIKVTSGGGISIKYDLESDMNRLGWDSVRQLGDLKKLTDENTNGFYRYFMAPATTWQSGYLRMD